jgi:raffinose/stachyose/melibiose transport system substrate-binding protein
MTTAPTAVTPVTLNWWTATVTMGNDGINGIIADYEAANPGVTIKYTSRPDVEYKTTLAQAVQTDAAPDIYEVPYGTAFSIAYAKEGASLPLDSYYSQYGWAGRFSQGLIDRFTVDGVKYNVPWSGFAFGMWYNKSVFTKAGIATPPATYDDLVNDMAKIKAIGVIPIGLAGKTGLATGWMNTNLFWQHCGWDKYNALVTLQQKWAGEPCVTQAMTDFKSWVDNGYFPNGYLALDPSSGQGDALVIAGKAGMFYAGMWFTGEIQKAGVPEDGFGFFAFPNVPGASAYGGSQLTIATKSKHADAAAKFLDYVTSVAVQTKYYGKINQPFSLTNGVTPPNTADPLAAPQVQVAAAAKHLFPPLDGSLSADVMTALDQACDQVSLGTLKPSEVGAKVDAAAAKQ